MVSLKLMLPSLCAQYRNKFNGKN